MLLLLMEGAVRIVRSGERRIVWRRWSLS